MAKTLFDVQREIAKLQGDAEKLKKAEAAGVIGRIKVAIEAYGFTPADLFGGAPSSSAPAAGKASSPKSKTKLSAKPQFSDGAGNEWVGRGPRPAWLRDALASGKSLSDFAIGRAAKKKAKASDSAAAKASPGADAPPQPRKAVAVKYKDGNGNTWTGRGIKPKWLSAAIESGKSVEDFLI